MGTRTAVGTSAGGRFLTAGVRADGVMIADDADER